MRLQLLVPLALGMAQPLVVLGGDGLSSAAAAPAVSGLTCETPVFKSTGIHPIDGTAFKAITYGANKFLLIDSKSIKSSTDGLNWTTVRPADPISANYSLKFVNQYFFMSYDYGYDWSDPDDDPYEHDWDRWMAQSSDGITWITGGAATEDRPVDVAYGNGKYVLVRTHGTISTFTDSIQNQSHIYTDDWANWFVGVAFGAGVFVAPRTSGAVERSSDGQTWSRVEAALPSGVTSVAFAGSRFAAATSTGIYASSNGSAWSKVFTPPAPLPGTSNRQLSVANGKFFYAGDNGYLAISSDGLSWKVLTSGTTQTVYQVAASPSLYVAGADTLLTSDCKGIPSSDVLGFETTSGWQAGSIATHLSSNATQGQHSLAVQAHGYGRLDSVPLSGVVVKSQVAYDVRIPTTQANPYWYGYTELYISAPSKGVYNQFIGHQEFAGFPLGQFRTVQMSVPAWIVNALAGGCSDLTIGVVLNVPANQTGDYLLDNMRFQ